MKRQDGSAYPGAGGRSGSSTPEWLDREARQHQERERQRRARVRNTNRQRMEWLEDAAFGGKQMGIFPKNANDAWNSVVSSNAPRQLPTVPRATAEAIKRKAQNINSKIGKP